MKRVLSAAISLSCLSVLATSPSFAFDSTPPKVTAATLSTNSLPSTGGSITVNVGVHTNSGLGGNWVIVSIRSTSDPSRTLAFGPLDETDPNAGFSVCIPAASATVNNCLIPSAVPINTDPAFSKTFNVAPGLMPGIYQLVIYPISDAAQNQSQGFTLTNDFVNYGDFVLPTPMPSTTSTPISETGTPTRSTSPTSMPKVVLKKPSLKAKTIICVRGKVFKRVVGTRPICPVGFKIKR